MQTAYWSKKDYDGWLVKVGSILGAALGYEVIPEEFRLHIELNKEMNELATDLVTFYEESEAWLNKYPAW